MHPKEAVPRTENCATQMEKIDVHQDEMVHYGEGAQGRGPGGRYTTGTFTPISNTIQGAPMTRRCEWCGEDPLYVKYHDTEWGVPVYDDRTLFEFLLLEGAQAGLSWITILRKRENYRKAFAGFDAEKVAAFGEDEITRLLEDPGIVRNRLKVRSAVANARCFLEVRAEFGGFGKYLWGFVGGKPLTNAWRAMGDIPATTPVSDALGKDLKRRGFNFVGSTIMYAHMQATGMVNDHVTGCFRHEEIKALGEIKTMG